TQRIEIDRAAAGYTGFHQGSRRHFAAGPALGPSGLRAERFYEGGTEGIAVLDRGRGGRGRDDRQTRDNRRDEPVQPPISRSVEGLLAAGALTGGHRAKRRNEWRNSNR